MINPPVVESMRARQKTKKERVDYTRVTRVNKLYTLFRQKDGSASPQLEGQEAILTKWRSL